MIGLDTNVLLRLFDQSDLGQTARARAVVERETAGDCYINLIVLCEFAWTLARTYKEPRALIAQRLTILLEASEFTTQYSKEAQIALKSYEKGTAGFVDYLLAEINLAAGCSTTLTFDEKPAKNASLTLVEG